MSDDPSPAAARPSPGQAEEMPAEWWGVRYRHGRSWYSRGPLSREDADLFAADAPDRLESVLIGLSPMRAASLASDAAAATQAAIVGAIEKECASLDGAVRGIRGDRSISAVWHEGRLAGLMQSLGLARSAGPPEGTKGGEHGG